MANLSSALANGQLRETVVPGDGGLSLRISEVSGHGKLKFEIIGVRNATIELDPDAMTMMGTILEQVYLDTGE